MLILWPAEHAQYIHVLCVTLRVFVCTVVVVLYSKKAPAVRHCLFHCLSSCHHIIYPLSSQPVTKKRIIYLYFLSPIVHLSLGTPKMAHLFVMDMMMPGSMEE